MDDARKGEVAQLMTQLPHEERRHWLALWRAVAAQVRGVATSEQLALIFFADLFTQVADRLVE